MVRFDVHLGQVHFGFAGQNVFDGDGLAVDEAAVAVPHHPHEPDQCFDGSALQVGFPVGVPAFEFVLDGESFEHGPFRLVEVEHLAVDGDLRH